MKRIYKLAADSLPPREGTLSMPLRDREIVEITDDGHRTVIVVVPNEWALDVRDALARAYEQGREDNAPHYHCATGTEDTPCYCPSPGTYAPQGNMEYGREEE